MPLQPACGQTFCFIAVALWQLPPCRPRTANGLITRRIYATVHPQMVKLNRVTNGIKADKVLVKLCAT
jgi:hypothetical protein